MTGRYQRKDWSYADGIRRAVPAYRKQSDLISTAYRNPDGSKVVYGIAFDLDASRAEDHWFDAEGRLDWGLMGRRLASELPELGSRIIAVTRSTGGRGLAVVVGINPLPIIETTETNRQIAARLQSRLINHFNRLGFGADPSAQGLERDFPSFENPARVVERNTEVQRRIEQTREATLSLLHAELNALEKQLRDQRLYPDSRVEKGLAQLLSWLCGMGKGPSLCLRAGEQATASTAELVNLTGCSEKFLRKFLDEPPPWLKTQYSKRENKWSLSLTECDGLERFIARANHLLGLHPPAKALPLLNTSPFESIKRPEEIEDGERNRFIVDVLLMLKWTGFSQSEAVERVKQLLPAIPGFESSRNCAAFQTIARSIWRNYPHMQGVLAGLTPPDWILLQSTANGTTARRGTRSEGATLSFKTDRLQMSDSHTVAKLDRCGASVFADEVHLHVVRRGQRVGVFDDGRMVLCTTPRHFRASELPGILQKRIEYQSAKFIISFPKRRDAYFAQIESIERPIPSETLFSKRETRAQRLSDWAEKRNLFQYVKEVVPCNEECM